MNNTLFKSLVKMGDRDMHTQGNTTDVSSVLQELLMKTKQRDIAKYQDLDLDVEFSKNDEKVSHLLAQYDTYATVLACKTDLSQKSKASFQRLASFLDAELNRIGDEMKFDNPSIWMKYKVLAYRHDAQKKIETI